MRRERPRHQDSSPCKAGLNRLVSPGCNAKEKGFQQGGIIRPIAENGRLGRIGDGILAQRFCPHPVTTTIRRAKQRQRIAFCRRLFLELLSDPDRAHGQWTPSSEIPSHVANLVMGGKPKSSRAVNGCGRVLAPEHEVNDSDPPRRAPEPRFYCALAGARWMRSAGWPHNPWTCSPPTWRPAAEFPCPGGAPVPPVPLPPGWCHFKPAHSLVSVPSSCLTSTLSPVHFIPTAAFTSISRIPVPTYSGRYQTASAPHTPREPELAKLHPRATLLSTALCLAARRFKL